MSKKPWWYAIALAVFTAFTILACQSNTPSEKLVLTGSSTVAPLAAEIAKQFESEHPGIRVDVQTGGSSRGIADVRQGLADIGMASRALKATENDLFAFTIAQDGIAMIVHKDNPVESLTNEQIKAIYTNQINNWQAVGGENRAIAVINKAEGRSTLELFLDYFQLKNSEIQADTVIGDNEQGIKTVVSNPDAIAYVSIGSAEYSIANGVPIKLLPMNAIAATTENVRNGRFPLSRPLNFVTKSPPTGSLKIFIDYARSSEVREIVEQQYFVPF